MDENQQTQKDRPELDIMIGMTRAFFRWVLMNSTDSAFIVNCFNDLLNHFDRYQIEDIYFGGFTAQALQEPIITRDELDKLKSAMVETNQPAANIDWLNSIIKAIDARSGKLN
jgi:hypothetical protein